MNRKQFADRLAQSPLLLDGAMGTYLHDRGIPIDQSFDAINEVNPELVAGIHQSYIDVGADVIETNSFGANRFKLASHGLQDRVRVHRSDLFDALVPGCWDLVVSNPPYVDSVDMASLPPEYRHEPALGLEGGADGLDLVARLLAALPERLCAGGLFVCEVGGSAAALLRRFPRLPFVWPDLPDGGDGVFLLAGDVSDAVMAAAPRA